MSKSPGPGLAEQTPHGACPPCEVGSDLELTFGTGRPNCLSPRVLNVRGGLLAAGTPTSVKSKTSLPAPQPGGELAGPSRQTCCHDSKATVAWKESLACVMSSPTRHDPWRVGELLCSGAKRSACRRATRKTTCRAEPLIPHSPSPVLGDICPKSPIQPAREAACTEWAVAVGPGSGFLPWLTRSDRGWMGKGGGKSLSTKCSQRGPSTVTACEARPFLGPQSPYW